MGDFFDAQESGELCMGCGAYVGSNHPSYCSSACKSMFDPVCHSKPAKVKCTKCEKMISPAGIDQHMEAKHKESKNV